MKIDNKILKYTNDLLTYYIGKDNKNITITKAYFVLSIVGKIKNDTFSYYLRCDRFYLKPRAIYCLYPNFIYKSITSELSKYICKEVYTSCWFKYYIYKYE